MSPKRVSQFEKLYGSERRGGRPKMTAEQKSEARKLQKIKYRRKAEAKKRATAVLAHKHSEEYEAILNNEYNCLAGNPKFDVTLVE